MVNARLRKAVVTDDFTFNSSADTYKYLLELSKNGDQKRHC